MKLAHLDPVSEFDRMNRVIDRLFSAPSSSTGSSFLPIDLMETEQALVVRASVPGLGPDDLNVTIEENVLTLTGEHVGSDEYADAKVYRKEIVSGRLMRSIRLPEGYDLDNVDASFDKGILTVTLPKLAEEKPKSQRIPVRPVDATATSVDTEVVGTTDV